ncbi:MAG: uroporphyrinogen-III C-methyltransferase [Dethiobacter sp.]|jgi:uroporphyrinogen III methyltransferase/synthase|nr:MAG: uroporphyrinogen-III C-methyltransferase [Dethiobacter sp.]
MKNKSKKNGKVYLVGAGPGDPGLITLKGLRVLSLAEVLVYDRLVNERLLSYARPGAELIYAGKEPGCHTLDQDAIGMLLVEKALEGHIVTRLKGGDPFIFGRGGEEAALLAENGIPFEIVPGVTSAVSVPAYAGIPVTHRGMSSSFAVITGHEEPGKNQSSIAWDKLAAGVDTLVFLMGMQNLPLITRQLLINGCSPATPVAVISWGTRPEQQTLTGNLQDIVLKVQSFQIPSPAVIVVGDVVSLHKKLGWFERKPLFGKRIVVTRSREQAGDLSDKIEELGGEPLEFPAIRIVPPADYTSLDRAMERIAGYDWLIFTSVNGVDFFFRRLRDRGRDIRDLKGLRLCAIGPRTRDALREKGLLVDYVPAEYRAEAVLKQLAGVLKPGERVLLPRADLAREVLPSTLLSRGAIVDNVEVYRTVQGDGDTRLLREMLAGGMIHMVTFTSSSTVRNFIQLLGSDFKELLCGVVLASIGPVTSGTAREMGLEISVEAGEYTIDGLIKAVREFFEENTLTGGTF